MGAFNYETSQGSSILHAGTLRVRKRLSHGLAVGGTYVYSKSIDDASSIGGGGAWWWRRIRSTSQPNADSPASISGTSLPATFFTSCHLGRESAGSQRPVRRARVFGDWTVSGSFTIASGTPFQSLSARQHFRCSARQQRNPAAQPRSRTVDSACEPWHRRVVQHQRVCTRRRRRRQIRQRGTEHYHWSGYDSV